MDSSSDSLESIYDRTEIENRVHRDFWAAFVAWEEAPVEQKAQACYRCQFLGRLWRPQAGQGELLIRRLTVFIAALLCPHKKDGHDVLSLALLLIRRRLARPLFVLTSPVWALTYRVDVTGTRVFPQGSCFRYANSTFSGRLLSSTARTVSRRFTRARRADLIAAALHPAAGFGHGGQQGSRL